MTSDDEKTPRDRELERIHKYGSMKPEADILGIWLREAMVGNRDYYLVDKDGNKTEGKAPGTYGIKYDSKSGADLFMGDVWKLELVWDQWVEARISCEHGTFKGSSDFFNVTEAIMRALVKFNGADHPYPEDENAEQAAVTE